MEKDGGKRIKAKEVVQLVGSQGRSARQGYLARDSYSLMRLMAWRELTNNFKEIEGFGSDGKPVFVLLVSHTSYTVYPHVWKTKNAITGFHSCHATSLNFNSDTYDS